MSALLAYEFDEVPLRMEYGLAVLAHMWEVKHITFYDSAYHVLAAGSACTSYGIIDTYE